MELKIQTMLTTVCEQMMALSVTSFPPTLHMNTASDCSDTSRNKKQVEHTEKEASSGVFEFSFLFFPNPKAAAQDALGISGFTQ